jgi:hypothetical protein
MLPAGDLTAVNAQETLFLDERVSQYWDNEQALGRLVSSTLNLTAPVAWIFIYFISPGPCGKVNGCPPRIIGCTN